LGILDIEGFEHIIGKEGFLIEDFGTNVTRNDKPVSLLPFIGDGLRDASRSGVLGFLLKQVLDGLFEDIMGAIDNHAGFIIRRGKYLTIAIGGFALRISRFAG
jgi:hypothetical protein